VRQTSKATFSIAELAADRVYDWVRKMGNREAVRSRASGRRRGVYVISN